MLDVIESFLVVHKMSHAAALGSARTAFREMSEFVRAQGCLVAALAVDFFAFSIEGVLFYKILFLIPSLAILSCSLCLHNYTYNKPSILNPLTPT